MKKVPAEPGAERQSTPRPGATPETVPSQEREQRDSRDQLIVSPAHLPQTPLRLAQGCSCVGTTCDGAARGPRGRGRVLGQEGDPRAGGVLGQGGPPGREAHLLDLLRDVGHSEAIEPGHPWEDIGQDAPVQLEGDLPNDAPVLLGAGKALDLCKGEGDGGASETGRPGLGGSGATHLPPACAPGSISGRGPTQTQTLWVCGEASGARQSLPQGPGCDLRGHPPPH